MSISLKKGSKISLSKEVGSLSNILVGLGWDVNSSNGQSFDLDAHAYLLGEDGKLISKKHHIYFGNLRHADVTHNGDNLTGDGDGDDEQITIKLDKLPTEVKSILFAVHIYRGEDKGQHFGMVKNSFVRIEADNKEICRYDLESTFDGEVIVEVGKIYNHNGEWKFSAVGEGYKTQRNFLSVIE